MSAFVGDPPALPADWHLESTHLVVPHASQTLMNELTYLLKSKGQILKVRPHKWTIKARLQEDCGALVEFVLKIRLFTLPDGMIAVEFQRRSGDVIGFHQCFRKYRMISGEDP
jgi:hypothetical protein